MAYTNLSTRSAGYLVTADSWNELVNNFLFQSTAAGLVKHEAGGVELDISAITTGGILRGASSGVMNILAGFLTSGGIVKHEYGGIEANISAIAAGGVLVGTGAGAMGILAKGTGLQALRVNSGASALEFATIYSPVMVIKTSDEALNSSASLQNDDVLLVALSASTSYIILAQIITSSPTAADFKFDFSTPTSPTAKGRMQFMTDEAAGSQAGGGDLEDDLLVTYSGTDEHSFFIVGSIRNGSNAGNLTFRWAQNASNGGATTVHAESWLAAIQVV